MPTDLAGPGSEPRQIVEATVTVTNPTTARERTNYAEVLGNVASLVKAIAWPLLVLYLFLQLREPLVKSVTLLPELLTKSSEIGVGSFSLKLQQAAAATGDPELGQLVQGLSAEAVDVLLNTGRAFHTVAGSSSSDPKFVGLPDASFIKTLLELRDKELLSFQEPWDAYYRFVKALPLEPKEASHGHEGFTLKRPLSEVESKRLKSQQYFLSPRGQRAFELVVRSIAGLVKGSTK